LICVLSSEGLNPGLKCKTFAVNDCEGFLFMCTKQFILQITFFLYIATILIQPCYAYRSIEFNGVERRDVIREDTLRQEAKFGDYDIKIYRDWDIGTFGVVQVFKDGEIVFEEQNYSYRIGLMYDNHPDSSLVAPGKDITGDGIPNLVISHWTGGMHCCFEFYVFSLGDEFRFIDKINAEHSDMASFKDVNSDGILDFITYDYAFAYWHESFAGSPSPQVILTFRNGRYRMGTDIMAKPAINDEQYYAKLKEYDETAPNSCSDNSGVGPWKKNGQCIKSVVWTHMLDLIYTGHPKTAWSFLDRIWAGDEPTKQAFLDDFKTQLALSDYSEDLPVDLAKYRPNIDNESDKMRLRSKKNVQMMIDLMGSIKEELNSESIFPEQNTSSDEAVERILHGPSRQ